MLTRTPRTASSRAPVPSPALAHCRLRDHHHHRVVPCAAHHHGLHAAVAVSGELEHLWTVGRKESENALCEKVFGLCVIQNSVMT